MNPFLAIRVLMVLAVGSGPDGMGTDSKQFWLVAMLNICVVNLNYIIKISKSNRTHVLANGLAMARHGFML